MRIDVNSFRRRLPLPAGARHVARGAASRPWTGSAIDQAWVTHLPSIFWRDPAAGNPWLYETAERHERLRPVPAVHPGLAGGSACCPRLGPAGYPRSAAIRPITGSIRPAPRCRPSAQACAAEACR